MECSKENKKRFFRKGQSHCCPSTSSPHPSQTRPQRSFDTALSSSCCGGARGSPSISSMDLDTLSLSSAQKKHLQSLQNLQNLQNIQALQNLQNLQNLQISSYSGGGGRSMAQNNAIARVGHHPPSGNSGSLDEAEINVNLHRKYMPAPRRARSAERFDGMRIQPLQQQPSSSGSGEMPLPIGVVEIPSRTYRSPQILRQVDNTSSHQSSVAPSPSLASVNGSVVVGGGPVNVTQQPPNNTPGLRRPVPIVGVPPGVLTANATTKSKLDAAGYPVPSPPPSYTTAINEARDPPPYHQVIGSQHHHHHGTRPGTIHKGKSMTNSSTTTNQHRYTHNHHNPTNSLTSTPTGTHGMRTVASTPIFTNMDTSCSCHKCQLQDGRCPENEYNDAVYMESQAFLMHEIMTDGMAFCSIM